MNNFFNAPSVSFDDNADDAFPNEEGSLTGIPTTEARLCTIQAIYQLLLDNSSAAAVKDDFILNQIKRRKADKKIFTTIFDEASTNLERFSEIISAHLGEGWNLEAISLVERAILTAAVAELNLQKAPVKVVINEFINISKSFCEEDKVKFINAVLDKVKDKI